MTTPEKRKPKPRASAVTEKAATPTATDTVLIHGVSDDGEKLAVLRARDNRLEAGIISKVKEGQPLHGELLRLSPRPDFPLLCDVEVTVPARVTAGPSESAPKLSHGGPAQVATHSYRANWDSIWSKKPRPAPN